MTSSTDGAAERSSSLAARPPLAGPHRLRLRSPGDLVVAAPYLLGFRPERSLVAIAVGGPGSREVRVTMRVDLPPADLPAADLPALVGPMLEAVIRAGGRSVLLLVYPQVPSDQASGPGRGLPSGSLVAQVGQRFADAGIAVREALCVMAIDERNYRYWSYLCADPRCCPPEGHVTDDRSSAQVQVGFVGAGLAPLPGREQLVALLAAETPGGPRARALRAAVTAHGDGAARDRPWARAAASRLDAALRAGAAEVRGELGVELQALLAAAIGSDPQVRDLLLAAAAREQRLDHLIDSLVPLVRRLARGQVAPVAATLAAAAYLEGHGALAWVAVDRALGADPEQSLALLVAACLGHGLPPHDLRDALTALPDPGWWDGSIPAAGTSARDGSSARARRR